MTEDVIQKFFRLIREAGETTDRLDGYNYHPGDTDTEVEMFMLTGDQQGAIWELVRHVVENEDRIYAYLSGVAGEESP